MLIPVDVSKIIKSKLHYPMNNLFALLVGIDDYQSPILPLSGCLHDVNKVEKYLKTYHDGQFNLSIKKLLNSDATYANIIGGFRDHLRQAGEKDVVWFHFSGHGSEEKTATEFLSIEENGKDQSLFCYDSLPDQAYNLADKELAVLLHEVSTTYSDNSAKENPPHIVVSLDCCHSGSGTRDAGEPAEIRTRNARSTGRERPLESYVDGYYLGQGNNLQVPSCPHVLLSACQSYQRAGDLNDGGAFTSGLVKALKSSSGQINYADLFIRTRASVHQIRKNQTPYFSSLNNFNPYTLFLVGSDFGDPSFYEVFFEKGKWYIKCGAIHGLPTQTEKPVEVEILSFPKSKVVGSAIIETVGAQQSELKMSASFQLKSTIRDMIPGEDHYRGIIKSFPIPPELVYIEGNDEKVNELVAKSGDSNYFRFIRQDETEAKIEVRGGDEWIVTDRNTGREVFKTKIEHADELLVSLMRIVKWYRFLELKNQNKKSVLAKRVDFTLYVYDTQGNVTPYTESNIKLYASPENSMGGQFGFMPKITIKDTSQDLHFYLMYLRPNFAIECPDDEVHFYANEYSDVKELEKALWKEIKGFGPGEEENSVTSNFKLLVTTEKLDYFQFLQNGLGKTRSELSSWNPNKISNDWAVFDMSVTICRQENSISDSESVIMNNGDLQILPHAGLKADISLLSLEKSTRNADAASSAYLLENENFRLVSLSNERSAENAQVLELNNIQVDVHESLKENPLELELKQSCAENELLVPMVFDGKYYRVAGESTSEGNKTRIKINNLPQPKELLENDPNAGGERSAFSSLKMAFFKLVLNEENTNKLSAIEIEDGELKSNAKGMAMRIMSAKRILVVLHGIFGDSLSVCRNLYHKNPDLFKTYDCILAYDYECLHTPLDETARTLKSDLMALNLHEHKDKMIDMVAHSCGGLVARWLIEQEGGNSFIQKLSLLGTPNAGTMFGKVEDYRSFALKAMEVAANFLPTQIPGVGLIMKVLKFAGNLTPSLGQMSPDSDFLTQLNTSRDPQVSYSIAAANAHGLEQSQAASLIKRLYNNTNKEVGTKEEHDLFTTTNSVFLTSIFNERSNKPKYIDPISGHHFGFTKDVKLE
jgi:hypothetical protein